MTSQEVIGYLEKRIRNEIVGIPIMLQSKDLKEVLPSFMETERILVSGGTGAGKTTFVFRLIMDAISYANAHPEELELTVIWNCVELPIIEMYIKFIQRMSFLKLNKIHSRARLLNTFQKKTVDEELLKDLDMLAVYIDRFNYFFRIIRAESGESFCKYIDEILHDQFFTKKVNGKVKVISSKNPKKKYIIVNDTMNALEKDSDKSEYDSIKHWSQYSSNKLYAGEFSCTMLNIQQLDVSSQTAQFTGRGNRVEEKHIPTSEGLAKVKTTPQDHSVVLGIVCPNRFHLKEVELKDGHKLDVSLFKSNLIMVYPTKANFGEFGYGIPFFVNYNTLDYYEIPSPKNVTLFNAFLKLHGVQEVSEASMSNEDFLQSLPQPNTRR